VLTAAAMLAAAAPALAQSPALTAKGAQLEHILTEARSLGRAHIIVEFRVPQIGIESEAGLAAQKANVRAMQDAIIHQTLRRSAGVGRMMISPMFSVRATLAEIERLAADPRVVQIYPNRQNRPNLIQSVPLIRGNVLRRRGGDGTDQIVAIIDSGVKRNHQFLQGKVLIGACFSNDGGAGGVDTACHNGLFQQIGPAAGEPCVGDPGCTHGTHVAGIAAGNNRDFQVGEPRVGVAPRASLLAIQVFSLNCPQPPPQPPSICAFDGDILRGLEFVFDRRNAFAGKSIAAANLSLGGGRFTSRCNAASPLTGTINQLKNAGIATVIAAGNEGFRRAVGSPACISTAIAVGASDKLDVIASFTNMSALVKVMAPGVDILSSVTPNNFEFFSGTSMAAPHVAGSFAALRTLHPMATVDEITAALRTTGVAIADTRANGVFTRNRIRLNTADDTLEGESAPSAVSAARAEVSATQ
jgi:subtilisin family serine protease